MNLSYRRTLHSALLGIPFFASVLTVTVVRAEAPAAPVTGRYGLFGLLDHGSTYGQGWFVEPLLAPEMDVDREIRVDYFHSEKRGLQTNSVKAELEYNFNLLTLEIEIPYERESTLSLDTATGRTERDRSEGMANIEFAVRHPIFQFVAADKAFDYTLAGAFELAIPSGSSISKDTEFVPKILNLIRVGDHLSIEASAGVSFMEGPVEGGINTLEYSLVLGYILEHRDLPIPTVLRTIPIFELTGERPLNGDNDGVNKLFGTIGFRLNFESIGVAQPRIGIGYVFPIDSGARDEMRWGIITSLVFEF